MLKGAIEAVIGAEKATVGKGDTILHAADTLHEEDYLEDTTFLEISYPKLGGLRSLKFCEFSGFTVVSI